MIQVKQKTYYVLTEQEVEDLVRKNYSEGYSLEERHSRVDAEIIHVEKKLYDKHVKGYIEKFLQNGAYCGYPYFLWDLCYRGEIPEGAYLIEGCP